MPSSGTIGRRIAVLRQHTAHSTATGSLRSKYQCPELWRLKPEISPRTRMRAKRCSSVVRTAPVISATVYSGMLETGAASEVSSVAMVGRYDTSRLGVITSAERGLLRVLV